MNKIQKLINLMKLNLSLLTSKSAEKNKTQNSVYVSKSEKPAQYVDASNSGLNYINESEDDYLEKKIKQEKERLNNDAVTAAYNVHMALQEQKKYDKMYSGINHFGRGVATPEQKRHELTARIRGNLENISEAEYGKLPDVFKTIVDEGINYLLLSEHIEFLNNKFAVGSKKKSFF